MKTEDSPIANPTLATAAILIALTAMGQVSIALYVPSMPAIAAGFDETVGAVTLTLTLFFVAFSFAQLIYGPLSDRFGRRSVLMGGIGLYVAASILCSVAPSLSWLAAGRFLQALGACSGPLLGRAMVRDIYGGEKAAKVMAYIGMAFAISPAVTPAIGGFLQVTLGWRANFVFLTLFGLVMLVIVVRRLPETYRPEIPPSLAVMAANYKLLLTSRAVLGYCGCLSFLFGGMMAYIASAPFVLIDRLGLTPDVFGLLTIFIAAGMMGGNFAVSQFTHRFGHDRMIRAGIIVSLVAAALMVGIAAAGILNVAVIIAPMTLYLFGTGLAFPNAMAAAIGPHPRMAGTASAIMGFVQMAAAALASRVSGLLPHESQLPMAAVILACAGLAALSFVFLVAPRKSPPISGAGNPASDVRK